MPAYPATVVEIKGRQITVTRITLRLRGRLLRRLLPPREQRTIIGIFRTLHPPISAQYRPTSFTITHTLNGPSEFTMDATAAKDAMYSLTQGVAALGKETP
jgi:hypothetical protein